MVPVRHAWWSGLESVGAGVRRATAEHFVFMTRAELELFVELWYHDFTVLGLPTPQRWGMFPANQAAKQEPLFRMVDEALQAVRQEAVDPTVLELFCADGFYAIYAAQQGASRALGIDTDPREIDKALVAARLLGVRNVDFRVGDVLTSADRAAIGICAGGLYHLSDPAALLAKLREQISHVLVIQTVFHIGRTEPDYFESPAPGQTWGSRFSWARLLDMTAQSGWQVVRSDRNELTGNDRPEDRGSAYLLCVPAPE